MQLLYSRHRRSRKSERTSKRKTYRRDAIVSCEISIQYLRRNTLITEQLRLKMKYFLVLCAVFFCWTFVSAGSIKCYVCIGTDDECAKDKLVADKAKYLVTCPFLSMDRCITAWAKKDDITSLVKLCSTKSQCDVVKKSCDEMTDGQCAVNCCDTDECNAGSIGLPIPSSNPAMKDSSV
ncbi:hypothetical protein ACROYT_G044569 [Oculina patagonica]